MLKINSEIFFNGVRNKFGPLNQKQVNGFNACIAYFENSTMNDYRHLAYALATAWHETGRRMEPVREGFADTNAQAIAAVTGLYRKGGITRNYALPHPNGNSYYGRGLVQITHGVNYEEMGKELNIDLYNQPDLALHLPVAVKILFVGMQKGKFTSKAFKHYFTTTSTNWVNARRIINALDKAEMIANHAVKFHEALRGK
jgi:Chitinase class I